MENVEHKGFGFSKHIFSYILFPLIIIIVFFSYYRFFIKHDYVVSYEGECDPYVESCFVGCEDDACTEEYYYSNVQKYAADLYAECGKDIVSCETASRCLPLDRDCSISFCDPTGGSSLCEVFTEDSKIEETEDILVDDILQDNINKKDI